MYYHGIITVTVRIVKMTDVEDKQRYTTTRRAINENKANRIIKMGKQIFPVQLISGGGRNPRRADVAWH